MQRDRPKPEIRANARVPAIDALNNPPRPWIIQSARKLRAASIWNPKSILSYRCHAAYGMSMPKDAVDYSAHQLLERARSLGFGFLAITLP